MPPTAIDLCGQSFGRLTVVSRSADSTPKRIKWDCRCECGGKTTARGDHLRSGATKSCGCLDAERSASRTGPPKSKTREYIIWGLMKARCYRKANDNYKFYGGAGKYVCRRWRESFDEFFSDLGMAPGADYSLDRIDTNGSYTCGKCDECRRKDQPANCRWASKHDQARNAKSNRVYTHDGRTMILKDWARELGITYLALFKRIERGWSFAEAISRPIGRCNRQAHDQSVSASPENTPSTSQ